MTEASRLSNHVQRTVSGPMWHGPALAEVLEGVTAAHAAARPVPGAHTIWELVLHITTWADIARQRLKGEALGDPSPSEDWPAMPAPSEREWKDAIDRLHASYRALAAEAATLDDAALRGMIPGKSYTAETMIRGVIEHGTYHGGQIALLARALAGSR